MLTEDYFMRMINQMVAVLVKISGLINAGRYQEAHEIIDQSLAQLLGMKAGLLKQLDEFSMLNILTTQGKLDSDRLYVVADLYQLEGDIYTDKNQISDASADYLRALIFYLEISTKYGSNNFSGLTDKIEGLHKKLDNLELPIEINILLFEHYQQQGNYREIEYIIPKLLPFLDDHPEILPAIITYYESLLKKSDQELINQGITRQLVQDNLTLINTRT